MILAKLLLVLVLLGAAAARLVHSGNAFRQNNQETPVTPITAGNNIVSSITHVPRNGCAFGGLWVGGGCIVAEA